MLISTMPIKNDGAEMPGTLAKTAEASILVFCFAEASMPSKMPGIVAINNADNAGTNVPG